MDATQEEWRPVVGYEGFYEVSSQGRVRSLDRILTFKDGRSRTATGRILKPWLSNRGSYPVVSMGSGRGPKRKAFVHVLVLEAFVGPRPQGFACCHNDGDPNNNAASNLRWDSYSENNKDLVRHGTHWQIQKTHCPQGHEYTPENTRIYHNPNGWSVRSCRTCTLAHSRASKERKKAQRPPDWRPRKSGPPKQSHCKSGHAMTPDNVYIRPDGRGRQCRKCRDIHQARVVQRRRTCE